MLACVITPRVGSCGINGRTVAQLMIKGERLQIWLVIIPPLELRWCGVVPEADTKRLLLGCDDVRPTQYAHRAQRKPIL